MTRSALHVLLLVGVVALAGCTGGLSGVTEPPTTDATSPAASQSGASPATTLSDSGTVAFYLSDEENAIGDFERLEVTVTEVGFERAAAAGGGWAEYSVDNETVDLTTVQGDNATLIDEFDLSSGNYTKVFVYVSAVNATLQDGSQVHVKLPSGRLQIKQAFSVDNGSQIDFVFDITVHKAGQSGKYILTPVISESGPAVPIDEVGEDGDRNELTVELVGDATGGANATIRVTQTGTAVENATVTANEVGVGTTDVDGRLTFGLPAADSVEITATKGGAEGELELAFEREAEEGADPDETAATLNATFVTNVTQGENATVQVTRNGSAVENATVEVNGEPAGTTDAAGELTFDVPEEDTLTVEVEDGDDEVELEREVESDGNP